MTRMFRVSQLIYRFESLNDLDKFAGAVPWQGRLGDFDVALEAGMLTATPRVVLTSAPSARVAIEPHLRAWEIKSLLRPVGHHIRFVLERIEFAATEQLEGRQNELTLRPVERHGQFTADAAISRENASYPQPDPWFSATPVVESLLHWIEPFLLGGGDLLVDAYRLLTKVEAEFGGRAGNRRRNAGKALGIEFEVLSKMGDLTARPDPRLARKFGARESQPLTAAEKVWLRAAAAAVFERCGQVGNVAALPAISMADLPEM